MTSLRVVLAPDGFPESIRRGKRALVVGGETQLTVNAWLARVAGRPAVDLTRAFEATFAALWQRTHLTLGEVTLAAVVERVLHTAKEQHPVLASLVTTTSGLRCEGLHTHTGLHRGDVVEAIRFVLVEFLTVLGTLTAQILTPALLAELANDHGVATDATEDRVP